MTSVPLVVAAEQVIPEGPCFVVSYEDAKRGETVDVTVSAIRNPGIVSAKVRVDFDTSVLNLVGYQPGDFSLSGYSWGEEVVANERGYFIINWCDSTNSNSCAELLATLTFQVLDDAAYGPSAMAITFSCEDDVYNYDWDTVDFSPAAGQVYVLYPVHGVVLNQSTLAMYNGDSSALTATVLSGGKADDRVQWATDNPAVAIVDENGVVTATGLGSATITVTVMDGGYGYTADCVVNVTCAHRNTTIVEREDSTCVTPGRDTYTLCDECGVIVAGSDAELPLVDHNYKSAVTVAATCGAAGVLTYTCTMCGDSYTEVIPATDNHTIETVYGYAATCTADGLTDGTKCSVCDTTFTAQQVIPALAHTYDSVVTVPDCENGGYTTHTCTGCGDSYVDSHVDALGHNYQLTESVAPTCTIDGKNVYTCENCGNSYTEAISFEGHKYDAVITAPDCENVGYTTHTCTVCGDVVVDNRTDALGHTYDSVEDKDCNVCGHVRPDFIPGDVDGNDKVNNRDLGLLKKYLNGDNLSDKTFVADAADLDGNGKINNRDLGQLKKILNNV